MQDSVELAVDSPVHDGTLQGLRGYLTEILGPNSLLLWRLVRGIETNDERLIGVAMSSLRLYSADLRKPVENAVLAWLFSAKPA